MMNSIYYKTHFRTNLSKTDFPESFAIITAYATTGELWTDEQNKIANSLLQTQLTDQGALIEEIDGYDPETGHCESCFIAAVNWKEACDIGLKFKQDAIYFVESNELFVTYCDDRKQLLKVSDFWEILNK